MIKKLILALMLVTACSQANAGGRDYQILSNIGPYVMAGTGTITISANSLGRNCLEYVIARSTNAYTIYVLEGGATNYRISGAANETQSSIFARDVPHCGSVNASMLLKLIPTSGTDGEFNYKGFIGK